MQEMGAEPDPERPENRGPRAGQQEGGPASQPAGGGEAWTGGGRLPDTDPELGSAGRQAPVVPSRCRCPRLGRPCQAPAVSLSSDPFQNFHLWSLYSGFTDPRGVGEGDALQARSSQEQQPSTPGTPAPGAPGLGHTRSDRWMLVRAQLRPQLSAPAQPGAPVGACPWLTWDSVRPFPLWASVLASVQWVVRTREAVMSPSSPVHLEIQMLGGGNLKVRSEGLPLTSSEPRLQLPGLRAQPPGPCVRSLRVAQWLRRQLAGSEKVVFHQELLKQRRGQVYPAGGGWG